MKSARINFGQPNTEYKLEINDAGEATSCYNQDTDTEYIGGGGGGDLSTAEVAVIFEGNYPSDIKGVLSTQFEFSEDSNGYGAEYNNITPANPAEIILYRGSSSNNSMSAFSDSMSTWYTDGDNATMAWSGNVNVEDNDIVITGDCVCTITIIS